jgi:hypothetical protein
MTYAWILAYYGPALGVDWEAQYRNALLEAWTRDSTTSGALGDHVQTAVYDLPNADWLRRAGRPYMEHADSNANTWGGFVWAIALASGDSARVRELRERAARGDSRVLNWRNREFVYESEWTLGLRHDDSGLLLRELLRRPLLSAVDSMMYADALLNTGIDQGKSRQAIEALSGPAGHVFAGAFRWALLIAYALVQPGFDSVAPQAAESLRVYLASHPGSYLEACHVELYRASIGDTLGMRHRLRALRSQFAEDHYPLLCIVLGEALVERWGIRSGDSPTLDTLEAMLRRGGFGDWGGHVAAAILTRLLRQQGRFDRALAATELHVPGYNYLHYVQRCPLLKEEGDLAAIVGDTARAITAYRKYLELRTDPDEGMLAEVEQVRASLNALLTAKG